MALLNAVETALKYPDNNYLIFSDSLSALQALAINKTCVKSNPYICAIKSKLCEFTSKSKYKIKFVWIPAHRGIQGNEEADQLAKKASLSTSQSEYKIPFTDLKEKTKETANANTLEVVLSKSNEKGVDYFRYYHKQSAKP